MIKFTPLYRYERILTFNESTTRDDYRFGEIISDPPPKKSLRKRLAPIKAPTNWSPPSVPFTLYHKNKEILQTHPRSVQKTIIPSTDDGKDEAIKTRPRLILAPAVIIDDIKDPTARAILVEDMYSSETAIRLKDAIRPYNSVKAPMTSLPAVANPIKLPKMVPPYISPEWRMETVTWDQRRLRSYNDSTKQFFTSFYRGTQFRSNAGPVRKT